MSLKENLRDDLATVFFNLDEFAEERSFRGVVVPCIVDDVDREASTGAQKGFTNISGIGVMECDRVAMFRVDDVKPVPAPGERVEMDDMSWIVGDGVSVTAGMLTLHLTRAW